MGKVTRSVIYYSIMRSMRRTASFPVIVILAFLFVSIHGIGLAENVNQLLNYTVIAIETIADFEGCEYGKIIEFETGASVICKDSGYQYTYYTDAMILVSTMPSRGKKMLSCKMVVKDHIYDIDCKQYLEIQIIALLSLLDQPKGDLRTYVEERLKLLKGIGLFKNGG